MGLQKQFLFILIKSIVGRKLIKQSNEKEGNILVFTQWSFKDALVQTYTLPYVNIIRKIIAPDRKIFLVTSEQENIALNER